MSNEMKDVLKVKLGDATHVMCSTFNVELVGNPKRKVR